MTHPPYQQPPRRPPHQRQPPHHQRPHHPPAPYGPPGGPLQKPPSDRRGRIFAGITGALMMLVSAPCIAAGISDLITKGLNSGIAVILIFFSGLCVIASMLLFYAFRKKKEAPFVMDRDLERLVLGIAKAEQGRLTTAELALQTNLSIDESEMVLTHLREKQIADFELLPDGSTTYLFPAFMSAHAATSHQHQSEMHAFDQQLNAAPTHHTNTTFDFDEGHDGQLNQTANHQHQQYKK